MKYFEGGEKMNEIFLDDRESLTIRALMGDEFKEMLKVKRLLVGDVNCGNICIERKEAYDFVNGVLSKRIFKQEYEMLRNFEYNYIIIVGNIRDALFNRKDPRRLVKPILGAKISIAMKIPVIEIESDAQFPYVVRRIIDHFSGDKKANERPVTISKKNRSDYDVASDMLCAIPSISRKKANTLLGEFGSVREIAKITDPKTFMRLDGFGKKLSESIVKSFDQVDSDGGE